MSNESFDKAYEQLNAEQKRAVDQVDGPVLVIAGPGTGKTQILAARIANILTQTDTLPENILCLTYTDAGTVAMRKRLLQFIGPDAYRVGIYTFHAFCNLVIQDHLELFGWRSLDAVSELEQIGFVHEIIDAFPKNHPLKRYTGEVYYDTRRLLGLYEVMKKEDWNAELIIERTNAYIADLPLREEFIYKKDSKYGRKGELKKKEYDAEVKRMEQLKAAALTFNDYQDKLRSHNRYDFTDMILWVIDAFRRYPEVLLQYQERFQYVLVDEFQDTSGSQNEVLQQLISYWDRPNVFVVGDDDQSIYRFQGANVENIRAFSGRYAADLQLVMLTHNYRSSQHILDAASSLIERNTERISQSKILQASNPAFAELPNSPEIRAYHNPAHEAAGIGMEIRQLQQFGIPLNEIAVIYRNHAQADPLIRYLQANQIPFHTKRRVDVFREPLIRKLITILRYLDAEVTIPHSGEHYLFTMLHYEEFKVPAIEIANLSMEIFFSNTSEKKISNITWREALMQYKTTRQPTLFSNNAAHHRIHDFSRTIELLIKDAVNRPLQELIEHVLTRSGILAAALTGDDKVWNLQLLNTFFDFVKSETQKEPKLQLRALLRLITLMEDNGVQLPAQKISYSETGVNFVTAHSSKGLEFSYVYMVGCLRDKWDTTRNRNQFALPDTLFEIEGNETEEARRLFYVAMTRARKQLVMAYPSHDLNEKELEKSRFIAELEETGIRTQQVHVNDEDLVEFQLRSLQPAAPGVPASLIDTHLVDALLEKYSLSVTHLNNYLRCPVSFYFNNLIRVPAAKSASMTFGSAVHYALEKLFRNMNVHTEKQFGTKEELLKDFRWYMRRNEDSFTEAEFKRRMEYGSEILPAFYDRYINDWNKVTSVERSYRNVVVNGVPLNGKLDKMEFDGNEVNVVDYKTGQFQRAEKKFHRPNPGKVKKAQEDNKEPAHEDLHGGDYWRQAVFYKILVDHDKTKNWEMVSAEFDFVEPDKDTKEFMKQRIDIIAGDVEIVQQQIDTVYRQIMNKEFSKGCGREDCEWCSFVNDYYAGNTSPAVQLVPQEEE